VRPKKLRGKRLAALLGGLGAGQAEDRGDQWLGTLTPAEPLVDHRIPTAPSAPSARLGQLADSGPISTGMTGRDSAVASFSRER
jgi:hypothetical protein